MDLYPLLEIEVIILQLKNLNYCLYIKILYKHYLIPNRRKSFCSVLGVYSRKFTQNFLSRNIKVESDRQNQEKFICLSVDDPSQNFHHSITIKVIYK